MTAAAPPITVLLATHNGARSLPAVLDRHHGLAPAPVPHQLVVVDSASTDETPEILRAEAGRRPLTLLREDGRGKNRALNAALPSAMASELVVLTDDDVLPEPDWLQRLWAAAATRPDFAMFGGTIRPHWPVPPPRWVFDWGVPLGVVYAATVWQRPGEIPADLVWGPNMAVRGAAFRDGHRFDEGIGPDGRTAYGMGSETEFTTRLARAGHRAWFVEDAVVEHIVRPEHLSEAWILGRAFRHGLGFHRYHPPPPRSRLPGFGPVPPGLAAHAAAYAAAARLAQTMPPCRARFQVLWQAEWLRGVAAGLRARAADGAGQAGGRGLGGLGAAA